MPKYWGKQIFAHGRFPEVGRKQKTEEKRRERERERERERLNNGDNNGQLRIANATSGGARKAAWAKIMPTQLVLCCAGCGKNPKIVPNLLPKHKQHTLSDIL